MFCMHRPCCFSADTHLCEGNSCGLEEADACDDDCSSESHTCQLHFHFCNAEDWYLLKWFLCSSVSFTLSSAHDRRCSDIYTELREAFDLRDSSRQLLHNTGNSQQQHSGGNYSKPRDEGKNEGMNESINQQVGLINKHCANKLISMLVYMNSTAKERAPW